MSFIVRNPNAVAFILADDDLYYEFAASENSVDLEEIFAWQKLYNSSIGSGALLAAITNGDIIRRNDSDTADIAPANAFDDAIWRWQLSKDQQDALAGSFNTPSDSNRFVTYADPVLFTANLVKVELIARPGEFSSIGAAMASITAAGPGNDWVVLVGPGLFIEDTITVKSNVTVQGVGISTIVAVNSPAKDLFVMSASSRVFNLAVTGSTGVGKALVRVNSVMDVLVSNVYFGNAYHFIVCESVTAPTLVVLENGLIRPSSLFTTGFRCISSGGFSSVMFIHSLDGKSQTTATSLFHASGTDADLSLADIVFRVEGVGSVTNGIVIEDGAESFCSSLILQKFNHGLVVPNIGDGPKLTMSNISIVESTIDDVVIEHPDTTGVVVGVWRNSFVTKDPAAAVSLTAADPGNSFYVNLSEVQTKDPNVVEVKKNPGPNDFSSVKAAIDSILTASPTNHFIVEVGPGIFTEDSIQMKPFVSVQGYHQETIIQASGTDFDLFVMSDNSSLSDVVLTGATDVGMALIKADSCLGAGIQNVIFIEGYHFIHAEATTSNNALVVQGCTIADISAFTTAFLCEATAPNLCEVTINSAYGETMGISDYVFSAVGVGVSVSIISTQIKVTGAGSVVAAVHLVDGGEISGDSMTVSGVDHAVLMEAGVAGSSIRLTSLNILDDAVESIKIDDTMSVGFITGVWNNESVSKVSGSQVSLAAADPNNSFYVNQVEVETRDINVVQVRKNPGPNDFTSIKAAVDSITTATMSNQFLVHVGPGIFVEDTIQMKSYVSVSGIDRNTTIIEVDDPDKFLLQSAIFSSISEATVRGGANASGGLILGMNGGLGAFGIRDCTIGSAYSIVNLGVSGFSQVTLANCLSETGVLWTNPFVISHPTGMNVMTILDFSYQLSTACDTFLYLSGPNCQTNISFCSGNVTLGVGGSMQHAIRINDGATLRCGAFTTINPSNGLTSENTGAGPKLNVSNFLVTNTTGVSLNILNPATTGFVTGTFIASQVFVDENASLAVSFSDPTSEVGFVVIGQLRQGDTYGKIANVTELLRKTTTLGYTSGGNLTMGVGLDLDISAGTGFIHDIDGTVREVSWTAGTVTLLPFDDVYIIVDSDALISTAPSYNQLTSIVLGRVIANATDVVLIEKSPIVMAHTSNRSEDFFRTALGPIFSTGCLVTETVGTPFALDIGNGVYYFGTVKFLPSGGTNVSWTTFHGDGLGGWIYTPAQSLVTQQYDDGTGTLASIPTGEYAKHALYLSGDGVQEKYAIVFAQATYATLVEVEEATLPIPPSFIKDAITRIASIVVQEGTAAITQIRDERPRIGFSASGVSAAAIHGNLLGLSANDHPQYLLRDGSAGMTGPLSLGGNSIINVNLVDGVDISAHASRHLPNGSDPLTTAIAFNIGANNVANIGTANAFSRSDHIHAAITGAPSTQTPDQANALGAGNALARADHVHNIPTAIVVAVGSANAQGATATFARADHVHEGVHGLRANASAYNFGNVTLQNGLGVTIVDGGSGVLTISTPTALFNTVFQVTYPGTGLSVNYTGGHIRVNDTFVNVASGSLLLSASEAGEIYVSPAGTVLATTASGSTPANYYPLASYTTDATSVTATADLRVWVNQNLVWGTSGSITTIQPDDAVSAGTSDNYARADHRHSVSTTAPTTSLSATTTNAEGAATSFARGDHTHEILTGVVSAQAPDQASAAGTSANLTRADHIHNIPTASAVGLDASSTSTQGAAATFSRADHTHAIASGVVSTQIADQANAAGSSANFARADHIHNIPTAISVSIGAANAIGASTSFARADHVHQGVRAIRENAGANRFNNITLLDGPGVTITDDGTGIFTFTAATLTLNELYVTYPGSGLSVNYTAGKVRFNGTFTSVTAGSLLLTASTSGEIFVDTDGVVKSGTSTSSSIILAAYTAGVSTITLLSDRRVWVNQNDTWGLVAAITTILPNDAASAGTQNAAARADHRHAIAVAAPAANLTAITTNAAGSASSFSRSDHSHAITTGAAATQTPDQANAVGSSASLARADHVHNIATAAAVSLDAASTNTQGVASTFGRSDHTHAIGTALVAELTTIQPDDAASAGTSNNFARGDHRHAIVAAAPSANLTATTTNIEGVATSFSRSDHSHAITTGAASAQTPDQANATGTSASLARADHVHNIATASAVTISANANAQGAAATFARADHTHQLTTTAALLDHVPQYDGSAWVATYPELLQNPDRVTFFRDDFTTGSIAATNFGTHSWLAIINGGGSTITNGGPLTTGNHPGVMALTAGNANARHATLTLLGTFVLGGGPMDITVLFQISTVTNDLFRIGLGDQSNTTDFNNGVYLEFNSATSANWLIKTANGGTRTSTTTSTAAVVNTWHKLLISVNAAATSVSFTLNGASLGTIITNIPTAIVGPTLISVSLGGTASTMSVDYYSLVQRFTSAR